MCEVESVCYVMVAKCHIFSSSKSGHCSVTICMSCDQTVLLSRLTPHSSAPSHPWKALLILQGRAVLIPSIKPAS